MPVWQENYMGRLIREYSEILNKKALPSEKFLELAKRIKKCGSSGSNEAFADA